MRFDPVLFNWYRIGSHLSRGCLQSALQCTLLPIALINMLKALVFGFNLILQEVFLLLILARLVEQRAGSCVERWYVLSRAPQSYSFVSSLFMPEQQRRPQERKKASSKIYASLPIIKTMNLETNTDDAGHVARQEIRGPNNNDHMTIHFFYIQMKRRRKDVNHVRV